MIKVYSKFKLPAQTPKQFVAKSRAQQHFKDQCDINKILARYNKTGQLTHIRSTMARYADVTNIPDLGDLANKVNRANAMFEELPSKIRDRFQNSPEAMLAFMADENNRDEAIKIGLIPAPVEPTPDPVLDTLKSISENTKPRSKSQKGSDNE